MWCVDLGVDDIRRYSTRNPAFFRSGVTRSQKKGSS
ncbi:hypothetical protein DQ393_25600 [Rhizobium tropici]|uniref:Uncharacterized protein n=1 Tax=Rhizobium tropici TaxID=398 RepID=A0A329Y7W6_RHITR|nr:hypothetical protein DQ393_25600 [Rhizobium tropici]